MKLIKFLEKMLIKTDTKWNKNPNSPIFIKKIELSTLPQTVAHMCTELLSQFVFSPYKVVR